MASLSASENHLASDKRRDKLYAVVFSLFALVLLFALVFAAAYALIFPYLPAYFQEWSVVVRAWVLVALASNLFLYMTGILEAGETKNFSIQMAVFASALFSFGLMIAAWTVVFDVFYGDETWVLHSLILATSVT